MFLDLISYGKFLSNLSSVLFPLYSVLYKESIAKWHWSMKKEQAFQKAKDLLTSSRVLAYFNPSLPFTLTCDASAYGIGVMRSIAYASRSLSKSEKNYCQLEKEALVFLWCEAFFALSRLYLFRLFQRSQLYFLNYIVLLTEQLENTPVTADLIHAWSHKDPIVSRVIRYVNKGWPKTGDSMVKPYESIKNKFSTMHG